MRSCLNPFFQTVSPRIYFGFSEGYATGQGILLSYCVIETKCRLTIFLLLNLLNLPRTNALVNCLALSLLKLKNITLSLSLIGQVSVLCPMMLGFTNSSVSPLS